MPDATGFCELVRIDYSCMAIRSLDPRRHSLVPPLPHCSIDLLDQQPVIVVALAHLAARKLDVLHLRLDAVS